MERKIIDLIGHISQPNIDTITKYTRLNAEMRGGSCVMVDIGTCAGKSAITMALSDPSVIVLTMDPEPNPNLFKQIDMFNLDGRIDFYREPSSFFYNHWNEYDGCFVDGIHNYGGVKKDIEGIVKRVRGGRYVMFHDVNLYSDILDAVREYEGSLYDFVEIVDGADYGDNDKAASIYVGRMK